MKIVFGGSGYIGSNICQYFHKKGDLLAGTYCGSRKNGLIHFDLQSFLIKDLGVDLNKADYAIICSGVAKVDKCYEEAEKSYRINVDFTKKLIEECFENNITPVFISSDYVYDGKRGNYNENDIRNPNTVYGKQKKVIEDFLETRGNHLTLRLSKIFSTSKNDGTLLFSWLNQLRENKEIFCAQDQIFCPTSMDDLLVALDIALQKRLSGFYNLASPEKFSRYRLANLLKSQLKIATGSVKPCSIRAFNFPEPRPLDTSMDCTKFLRDTGYNFHSMSECINSLEN